MGQLEDLITDLRDFFFGVYMPQTGHLRFPIDDATAAQVRLKDISASLRDSRFQEIHRRLVGLHPEFQAIIGSNRGLAIAGMTYYHDFAETQAAIWMNYLARHVRNVDDKSLGSLNQFVSHLNHLEIGFSNMLYFASNGKEKELDGTIPIKRFKSLFEVVSDYDRLTVDISRAPETTTLTYGWYLSAVQFVTNAVNNSFPLCKPDIMLAVYYTTCPNGQVYKVIEAQDNAAGVCENGRPWDDEHMWRIFAGYSPRGGGTGGQISAAVIDFADKTCGIQDIDILTRVEGFPVYYFRRGLGLYSVGRSNINRITFPDGHLCLAMPEKLDHGTYIRMFQQVSHPGD
ncbi:MAG TPA: hypothetical protein VFF28_03215 [Candidatus Nanoarchaeia archaeon]|nr:hypothetical protein [Candidatus Nanoarchaeia archaeon]